MYLKKICRQLTSCLANYHENKTPRESCIPVMTSLYWRVRGILRVKCCRVLAWDLTITKPSVTGLHCFQDFLHLRMFVFYLFSSSDISLSMKWTLSPFLFTFLPGHNYLYQWITEPSLQKEIGQKKWLLTGWLLNPDHTEGKLYNHQEKLGLGGSGGLGNYKRWRKEVTSYLSLSFQSYPGLTKMAKIKKKMLNVGTHVCWWGCKLITSLWKTV